MSFIDRVRASGRARLIAGAAIVALIALIGAWFWFGGSQSTDDAQIDAHIHPVAARVGGTVMEVDFEENQRVKAGDVLVKIDPKDYQVALARAEADLADAQAAAEAARAGVPIVSATSSGQLTSAQAKVSNAQAGIGASTQEIAAARAKLDSANARLRQATVEADKATRDRERLKPLVEKDEVSRQQFESVSAGADAALAAVDSAKAAVAETQQGVALAESRAQQAKGALAQAQADLHAAGTAPEQVSAGKARASSAEARIQVAQAAVNVAKLNLGYTTIVAPVSGVVGRRNVEVGQVIQPGQPLVSVVDLGAVWVTANFKETQLKNMRQGQKAKISVDAFGGHDFQAHVDSIGAATGAKFSLLPPENATGNYVKVVQRVPVKLVLEKGQDPERLLRPGMSVDATVYTK
jgi:membrane fusion protein (multidrug efflux system)